ncbi:unnamed protein product [Nesidiocoris tenuis]|uniref:Uncharacterized protein n=1 Tax=Nesidiocoris tenuis TaxID=355587 RepID=A0A6H5H5W0_9HEMI|nr:unnamed protein product [Nesidiocoris tenuis]
MEVMEEGNLLDRVSILLQRDSGYYEEHQSVLQESICNGIAGGVLDFPHHASFASVKMVRWWEQHFISIFGVPSGLIHGMEGAGEIDNAGGNPDEFVSTVTSCCTQLMSHLHNLSQEALDHADLQVLTSTLGAAALVANALWIYNHSKKLPAGNNFPALVKEYQGMKEALAERVLDLHCRLTSLYVLQDADCLNWEDKQPFFESERGSFVVQMWWLYMQGTRQDLWNTLPPKTAQRVFAGMLNESLTIFLARYSQAVTSQARLPLIPNDICNILRCVAHLLPALSSCGKELTGEKIGSQVVSQFHDKCNFLLTTLLFRGAPLSTLHKIFFRGLDTVECFKPVPKDDVSPWFAFVNDNIDYGTKSIFELTPTSAINLELNTLKSQPNMSWALLLKVWNQKRHGWLEAIVAPLLDFMNPVVKIINKAVADNASIKELTELAIALLIRSTDCLPSGINQVCSLLQSILPADCNPMGGSVLAQLLFTALYSRVIETPPSHTHSYQDHRNLCCRCSREIEERPRPIYNLECSQQVCELLVSQLLLTRPGRLSLKVLFEFIKNDNWLLTEIGQPIPHPNADTLLYTMFHIGNHPFDEVKHQVVLGTWNPLGNLSQEQQEDRSRFHMGAAIANEKNRNSFRYPPIIYIRILTHLLQ